MKIIIIRIVAVVACILLLPASCTLVTRPLTKKVECGITHDVSGTVPGIFPVLVVFSNTTNQAQGNIMSYRSAQRKATAMSGTSFLIPQSRLDQIRTSIQRPRCSYTVTIEEDRGSEQDIMVREDNSAGDTVNVGWYVARSDGIKPTRHLFYFGPALFFSVMLLAFVPTLILWGLCCMAIWFAVQFARYRHEHESVKRYGKRLAAVLVTAGLVLGIVHVIVHFIPLPAGGGGGDSALYDSIAAKDLSIEICAELESIYKAKGSYPASLKDIPKGFDYRSDGDRFYLRYTSTNSAEPGFEMSKQGLNIPHLEYIPGHRK